jgi:hypothetical protein
MVNLLFGGREGGRGGGDIGWVGLDSMLFLKEFFDASKVVIIHRKMWKK